VEAPSVILSGISANIGEDFFLNQYNWFLEPWGSVILMSIRGLSIQGLSLSVRYNKPRAKDVVHHHDTMGFLGSGHRAAHRYVQFQNVSWLCSRSSSMAYETVHQYGTVEKAPLPWNVRFWEFR
jgi:hypothetical protein